MAKFPRTPGNWSMNASYSYEYPLWNTRQGKPLGIAVQNEIARLDFLEQEIQNMLTYPDAERIINTIKGGTND
jgi:hypothetical protein